MRQFFITALLVVTSVVGHSQTFPPGYKIEGSIQGLPEKSKIYLINGAIRKRIDSAIVTNSHFTLTGSLAEPAHTYLYLGKTNKLADILLDNRPIQVTGTAAIYDSVKVSGSDIDAQWKEWYQEDQRIGYTRYRLEELHKLLIKKNDLESAVILKTVSEDLLSERIRLLKRYVKRYSNSPSGAILPTLCTIQSNLTRSDYLEMYEALSIEMKSTTFGKEILGLARKSEK